jgi:hypothetical protein
VTVAPRRRERLCGSEPRCSPFASRAFCVYTRSCFLGAIPRTHVWSAERLKGFVCPVRCMHVPASPAPSGWLLALAYLLTRTCCLSSVVLSARWPLPAQGALVYFNSILKLLKRRGLKVYLSCDRWADLHGGACVAAAAVQHNAHALRALLRPYGHGTGVARGPRIAIWTEADTACSYTGRYRRGRGKGLPSLGYPSPNLAPPTMGLHGACGCASCRDGILT